MPKNIAIFSDGTGQDGSVRPEQRMSNVFKLYRATRPGPDNPIDARQQVAFYDAGLGTDEDAGTGTRLARSFHKLIASAFGSGISTNITDAYEFILNHYEPGDRIFLFGFSRGAYTARCVANLLTLCGVPSHAEGIPIPRFRKATRDIANEAVSNVFESGAGEDRESGQAMRSNAAFEFRNKYGSQHPESESASNVSPYFVGVFDSVAALGANGPRRVALAVILGAALSTICVIATWLIHWATNWSFWWVLLILGLTSSVGAYRKWSNAMKWRAENYDRLLSGHVAYARHALAIDETRADFDRVRWGSKVQLAPRPAGSPEPFIQLWFAGNHSDIGGSYPEAESRLSDISLGWMVEQALEVPHPLIVDATKLNRFPSVAGIQHCEVAGMQDWLAQKSRGWSAWIPGLGWATKIRDIDPDAPVHDSVAERFKFKTVPQCGGSGPYRPAALRNHNRFKEYF